MAEINIISTTKYHTPMYRVVVGTSAPDEFPVYVVMNKETQVPEFATEVLAFAREWLEHFQARLDELDNPKTGEKPEPNFGSGAKFN